MILFPDYTGPGISKPEDRKHRDPYDVSTWGPECARGVPYAATGAPIRSGEAHGVRKISVGRKARGSASHDLERTEDRAS